MIKWLISILFSVISILFGGIYLFQESLFMYPEKLEGSYEFRASTPVEEYSLDGCCENVKISAVRISSPKRLGDILYFHGNGGNIGWYLKFAERLSEKTGWNVWLVDYPGYGKSTGSVGSEADLKCSANLFVHYVKRLFRDNKVIVFGYSMGTFLAAYASSENKLDGLILQAPYYNAIEQAKFSFPFVPTFFLRYKLDTNKYLSANRQPVLILHGTDDHVVSIENSERLIVNAPKNSSFMRIQGGTHDNLEESELYWNEITAYVSSRQ